jgi:hypothetical protein
MTDVPSVEASSSNERRRLIKELLTALPENFYDRLNVAHQIRNDLQEALADSLQASFRQFVASEPRSTLVEKATLAKSINAALRGVGLGVRDPKSGLVASIGAESRGDDLEGSRFRLQISSTGGRRHRSSLTDEDLLSLTLAPDEEWKRWYGETRSRS